MSNALKFARSTGGAVEVIVEKIVSPERKVIHTPNAVPMVRVCAQEFVRVSVVDNGCGISIENQRKLFGQYVQFNASELQKGGGSGLGLWISKSLVELHGGIIGAKSEGENTGSTFFFEFPLYDRPLIDGSQPPVDEQPPHKIHHPATTEEKGGAPGTLLQRITRAWKTVLASAWDDGCEERQLKLNAAILAAAAVVAKDKADAKSAKEAFAAASSAAAVFVGEDAATVLPGSGNSHLDGLIIALPAKLSALLPPLPPVVSYEHLVQLSQAAKEVPAPISVCRSASQGRRLSFLIADDSAMSRKVTKRLLILHGHEVEEASDGLDFLRKMGALTDSETCNVLGSKQTQQAGVMSVAASLRAVDVILMDDNMPNLSGPDATAAIRSCGYMGLIVGVTGNLYESQVAYFLAKGADRVVAKPLDLRDLEEVIREKMPQATLIADTSSTTAATAAPEGVTVRSKC